jgi:tetratricopeptide (TPR) repeat protein
VNSDRYGNPLTTNSPTALDQYNAGMDRFLAYEGGVFEALNAAITADEGFALAHLTMARFLQIKGNREKSLAAFTRALATCGGASPRELSLIAAFAPLFEGRPAEALDLVRKHLADYPRDAMALQTSTTVFGLIGFSGLPGREAEQLALTSALAPHYGEDWWFLSQHAFSQIEVGKVAEASANIERSFELNPNSAQMAHIRSHVYYESGAKKDGYDFLRGWLQDYDREGLLHGHLSWHLGLWALDRRELDFMWSIIDDAMAPENSTAAPLVVLCDMAALLYRAGLSGVAIPSDRWRAVSDYASKFFPVPGMAFCDVHAALAHAMAGNREPLAKIISEARGPAADVVRDLASAYAAIANENWSEALQHLVPGMTDHARIGGSKAQRDLLEYTLSNVLLKLGRREEAQTLLSLRRPVIVN